MSININNLSFTYDKGLVFEKKALRNVSFTANPGEIIGIIGQTGSGKSTLIQHCNGLISPTEPNQVMVDDLDLYHMKKTISIIRKKVGLVFQYPEAQLFEETVEKDVAFGLKHEKLSPEESKKRVETALSIVGLAYESYRDKSPLLLSGGEKRRIALAGIIVMNPQYLILDEPTAGLDPFAKKSLLEEIKRINRLQNVTIIMVSHDMDEIADLADRIYVMDKGAVVLHGTPAEVFSQYDQLEALGLSLPETSRLLHYLSKTWKGIDISVIDPLLGADIIFKYMQEQGKWN
ncbi:energy-coupling factor transporter ATPase [bacterium]|nr:energy-coupling factor transporter ATPase [bacterium]